MYEPEDRDQLLYYREAQGRPDPARKASTRPARFRRGSPPRRRYAHARRDHAAVLHLLFDVRLPARRRPGVGRGRMRARGFLLGGTAGRTTLYGEGLQHEDGHCHCCVFTVPNCVAYDPGFGYELAIIIADGLRRMVAEQEDVFYYVTVMNENYVHPALPAGAEQGI